MLNRQGRVFKDCLLKAKSTDILMNKSNAASTMDHYSYCISVGVLANSPELTWLEGLATLMEHKTHCLSSSDKRGMTLLLTQKKQLNRIIHKWIGFDLIAYFTLLRTAKVGIRSRGLVDAGEIT